MRQASGADGHRRTGAPRHESIQSIRVFGWLLALASLISKPRREVNVSSTHEPSSSTLASFDHYPCRHRNPDTHLRPRYFPTGCVLLRRGSHYLDPVSCSPLARRSSRYLPYTTHMLPVADNRPASRGSTVSYSRYRACGRCYFSVWDMPWSATCCSSLLIVNYPRALFFCSSSAATCSCNVPMNFGQIFTSFLAVDQVSRLRIGQRHV